MVILSQPCHPRNLDFIRVCSCRLSKWMMWQGGLKSEHIRTIFRNPNITTHVYWTDFTAPWTTPSLIGMPSITWRVWENTSSPQTKRLTNQNFRPVRPCLGWSWAQNIETGMIASVYHLPWPDVVGRWPEPQKQIDLSIFWGTNGATPGNPLMTLP